MTASGENFVRASDRRRVRDQAAIGELAAVFLFTTPPTDRALAGWGVFGDPDERGRGPAIIHRAVLEAATIVEAADEYL